MSGPNDMVRMVDPDGRSVYDVPASQVADKQIEGFTVEGDDQAVARLAKERVDERNAGIGKTILTGVQSGVSAATLGGYDAVMRTVGGKSYADYRREQTEAHPIASVVGDVVGSFAAPVGAIGKLAKGGVEATSTVGRVLQAGRGAAAEGAAFGIGSGVTEVAKSAEPIDLERAISTISSHALYAGGIGGAAGSIGKLAEIGLSKARGAIDDVVAKQSASQVTDDLAGMDAKQLRAAREVEVDALKTSHKVEAEAIEATRVTERQAIADEIGALRREIKDTEQWATTKGLKMPASAEGRMSAAELGAIGKKSDSALMRLAENPIGLAKDPRKALDALQRQEYGLTKLLEHGDELRAAYAVDGLAGKRMAALEAAPQLLEKNRALQQRIAAAHAPVPAPSLTSPRLDAIEAAKDAMMTGGKAGGLQSIPQRMVEGSAFGTVTGAIAALPIPGAALAAPMVGAAVSKMVGEKVFGRLAKGASEQAIRTGKAVSAFLGHAEKGTKAAIPVATKVLSSVRFAPADTAKPAAAPSTRLVDLYHERANEVRSQTAYGPDGKLEMRPEARADLADRLKGVAALDVGLADQLETLAARRIEFLASKLPKRPELGGIPVGPDRWHPSDMEMRKWARYVAGVEDPGGIEERLAQGTVSVEDADVMRSVYPERLAEITRQIVDQMPTMRVMLPYQKRLALSIMTGTPVVAAMDPRIMSVLQESFAAETPTEGGPPGAIAKPQFGSVTAKSAPAPTPAQSRAG
jgi:hypothetical protein